MTRTRVLELRLNGGRREHVDVAVWVRLLGPLIAHEADLAALNLARTSGQTALDQHEQRLIDRVLELDLDVPDPVIAPDFCPGVVFGLARKEPFDPVGIESH